MLGINGLDSIALCHTHDQLLYHTCALMGVADVNMFSNQNVSNDRICHPIGKESHVSISNQWNLRYMVTLQAILHVSDTASNILKFVCKVRNFMAPAYQTLA